MARASLRLSRTHTAQSDGCAQRTHQIHRASACSCSGNQEHGKVRATTTNMISASFQNMNSGL